MKKKKLMFKKIFITFKYFFLVKYIKKIILYNYIINKNMFGIDNKLFYVLGMAAGLIGIMFLLNKFFNNKEKENFETYKEELKEIAAQAEAEKLDKYEAQGVSQETPEEQLQEAEQIMDKQEQALAQEEPVQPSELLPAESDADEWARANPKGEGSLELKNFTEAAFHIGVDTQGNSLRNANLQIRSEPPNPIKPVSIFNNSTIGPDPYRRPLEIA